MKEWQSFRREVGAGSSRQDKELDFKINSETEDGVDRGKQDGLTRHQIDLADS